MGLRLTLQIAISCCMLAVPVFSSDFTASEEIIVQQILKLLHDPTVNSHWPNTRTDEKWRHLWKQMTRRTFRLNRMLAYYQRLAAQAAPRVKSSLSLGDMDRRRLIRRLHVPNK